MRLFMNSKKVQNICIILLIIVLFVYLVIFMNSIINKNTRVGFFSTKFYIMTSESKETNINSGDLVLAKIIPPDEIQENDSIIFVRNNELIVKKIKNVEKNGNETNFYIQEDNVISNEKLENAQIIGKVVKKVKGIGNIALFIQSPLGTLNILFIIICILIIIKKVTNKKSCEDSYDEEKSE